MLIPQQPSPIDQALLRALPYPLYIVDCDFVVRQTNPSAEELNRRLGIVGVLPEEVRRQLDDAVVRNHDMVGDDIRRAVPLSATQTYLPQIFRLAGAFGTRDGWAVLLVEVTRLRRNLEANAKILSMLSHDVKTPLTGIRLSLHLLLEEKLGSLNPDQRELLEVARDECEHMLATVQTQLELARFESGHTKLQLQPISPNDLLAEAVINHGGMVKRAGGELKIEVPDGLPDVLADLQLTNRVLGNLISNAGKYGTKGQPVVLRAQLHDRGYVRFSVVHHGRPLSESEQIQIFDPFLRHPDGDTASSGLGMAICREIVSLHGGRLGIHCHDGSELVEFFFDLRSTG